MNADLHISDNGLDTLIRPSERFVDHPYHGGDDAPGVMTVGWGHKILAGEVFATPMTAEAGEALLRKDTTLAELVVKKHVNPTTVLNQNQFDALVSLVFNIGGAAFVNKDKTDTHLAIALNSQNMTAAADAILLFNHSDGKVSNGLTTRRHAERALFLKPTNAVIEEQTIDATKITTPENLV